MQSDSIVKGKLTPARLILFVIGVFCVGLGVALITKSGLGTSAVTSLSYVLSFVFPPSLGTFVFCINVCMVIAQALILRKRFRPAYLFQIPAAFLFSSSIDLFMALLKVLVPQVYPYKLAVLLAGCVVFGAGIAMEVRADVIVLPAEAIVKVISEEFHKDFGTVKTTIDVIFVAAAILISLAVFHQIRGVREGTVITALIVGSISRFFLKLLPKGTSQET